uniref:Uncharacterized protein n=2 Tax=Clytia hemisphaerica TaxID=252671 RepID=A0A7M5WYB6_9CNID
MTGYSKNEIPFLEDENKTVNINISIYVLNIGNLNTVEMTFEVEMYLELDWMDPRLAFKKYHNDSYILIAGDTAYDNIWVPDLFVRNMKYTESSKFLNDLSGVMIYPEGRVWLSSRMRVVSHCEMDLIVYPFDKQSCNLMMISYLYNTGVMSLHWSKDPVVIDKMRDGRDRKPDTWMGLSIVDTKTDQKKYVYPITKIEYEFMIATFVMKRKSQYFLLRGFIPSSLLVSLTWASFWLPTSSIPARVALVVTSFLASIVLYQGSTLHVDQMSIMQIYLLGNIAFTGLTLIEFLLAINAERKENRVMAVTTQSERDGTKGKNSPKYIRKEIRSSVDRKARYMMPVMYLIYVGVFVAVAAWLK